MEPNLRPVPCTVWDIPSGRNDWLERRAEHRRNLLSFQREVMRLLKPAGWRQDGKTSVIGGHGVWPSIYWRMVKEGRTAIEVLSATDDEPLVFVRQSGGHSGPNHSAHTVGDVLRLVEALSSLPYHRDTCGCNKCAARGAGSDRLPGSTRSQPASAGLASAAT